MINKRDVIRMKVPYPSIGAQLAVSSHMYVCITVDGSMYEYVKCQTLKPKMLASRRFKHFIDEQPDVSRNPFQRMTRIDCDKVFVTKSVQYGDGLKTNRRPDVCQELYDMIVEEVNKDGYDSIGMNEDELTRINPLIVKMKHKA